MKIKGTPVIIRETSNGNIVALFPTLPGTIGVKDTCQLMTNSTFAGYEEYSTFMKRTSPASYRDIERFMEMLCRNWGGGVGGAYTSVKSASAKMHAQRRGDLGANADMVAAHRMEQDF